MNQGEPGCRILHEHKGEKNLEGGRTAQKQQHLEDEKFLYAACYHRRWEYINKTPLRISGKKMWAHTMTNSYARKCA